MSKVSIIIPIYKEQPDNYEIISLKRCFEILGKHDIYIISPNNLNLYYYSNLLNINLKIERFEKHYFNGISGYNKLMLSQEFYGRFLKYDYILIYQLDCYVFRDELDYWCEKKYDYIGAPWLVHNYVCMKLPKKIIYNIKKYIKKIFFEKKYQNKTTFLFFSVGNGGFSLRRIKKFISILNKVSKEKIEIFTISNDRDNIYNEDVFWSFEAKLKKPNYKIASKFSLDLGVDIGIQLNKGKLPFGCHKWYINQFYWKDYIPELKKI
jgi:hypothetical protein